MKITVDRNHVEGGNLVFTITASPSDQNILEEDDIYILKLIDSLQNSIDEKSKSTLKYQAKQVLQDFKCEVYDDSASLIRNKIEIHLRQMLKPICQEIYTWLMDQQPDQVRMWMYEFNPERTKYYFSNDQVAATCSMEQESEHDGND